MELGARSMLFSYIFKVLYVNYMQANYSIDYTSMIEVFKGLASNPKIFINTPPPVYKDGEYGKLRRKRKWSEKSGEEERLQ